MRSPSTRPFPGVVIPPEAEPYCDTRGIIDWVKVAVKLGLNPAAEFWGWRLPSILKGTQDDDIGVLRKMRDLKLDCIVNSLMASNRRGSTNHSHRRAVKFAQDFDIPLDQVSGSGPGGLVLKRDVVAYRLGVRMGSISTNTTDSRLLRQRRILANHLRECIRTNRTLCGTLAATQDARRRDSGEWDARFADAHGRYRREVDELTNRLAATANALGDAKADLAIEKIANATLAEQLQHEQESNARMEAKLRRLSARPRVRRGTTHIEIGGLTFRNRTTWPRAVNA